MTGSIVDELAKLDSENRTYLRLIFRKLPALLVTAGVLVAASLGAAAFAAI